MKRLLFSFLFVLTAIAGWAQEQEPTTFTVGNFKYTVTDEENHYVAIAKADEVVLPSSLVIPSSVTNADITYTVTSIADYGFGSNENITEVTIPNTVTSIGEWAFSYCYNLTTITLPSTLTSIGNSAFYYCSSLASFSVPASVTTIGSAVFNFCSIPTFTFEASNTAITCNSGIPCTDHLYLYRDITQVFEGSLTNSIKSLTIGANVTTIYNSMFDSNSKLSSIDFSAATGLTSIGNSAFNGCGNSDALEEEPAYYLTTVDLSNTKVISIGESAFSYCYHLTTITLPSTLTSIGNSAFYYCSSLESFSVPGSVTTIGSTVFDFCNNLTDFTFEASNTTLNCAANIACTTNFNMYRNVNLTGGMANGIKKLTFGDAVTGIGAMFSYCNEITDVIVPWSSPKTIDDDAFSDETFEDATLWIPGGTKATYEAADGWKKFANMEFSSFVVSITGSAHGTLAVGEIESTGGVEETTLIDRGEDAVFTVTPATGYETTTFTVNSKAAALTDNSYTVEDLSADQTVVAGFTAISYTIGYDLAGGSVATPNPTAYTIESSAITLNNPTKTGYTFAGWTGTDLDAATTEVTIAAGSTGIRSYTATWTPTEYNITLTLDGGTATPANPTTYTIETETFTLNNPTKTGYTFKGWKQNGEGDAMMEVTIAQGSTGHLAYTATWTPTVYNIVYTMDGGTATPANPTTYTIETETFTLNNPTKAGYDFAGWKLNGEGDAMMEVTIAQGSTGHLAYTATWTPTEYNITLTLDGGTAVNPTTYTIESEDITLNNPTKTGYTFKGWKLNGVGEAQMTVTITTGSTGDVAYTATWQVNQYTITFDSNGGSAVDAITQDYGTTITPPADPTRTGYDFDGWSPAVPATMPAENMTVVAQWTKATYTVTITGGGVTADNTTPEYGDNVVLTIMDDPDAELISLTVNGNDVTSSIVENHYTISGVTGNVSVVATWNSTKEFITLGSDIATFSCTQDLNFTGSELKAYIAAGYSKDGNTVLLVRVYDVPANTGLVIKGTQGDTYKIPYSTSQSYFVNMLKAHTTADAVPVTEGDYTNFILQKNEGDYVWNHKGEGTMSLGAKKAYLQLPTSFVSGNSARQMSMIFEDELTPTEIRDNYILLQESKYNGRIYNVSGQQIETLQKGVNIVNGRKILK